MATRISRVDRKFYKLEVLEITGAYSEASARAVQRALSMSGLSRRDFFAAVLRKLGITTDEALAIFKAGKPQSLDIHARSVLNGEIIPCFDFMLAAAEVAGTTMAVLLDERPLIEQVRQLSALVAGVVGGAAAGTTMVS